MTNFKEKIQGLCGVASIDTDRLTHKDLEEFFEEKSTVKFNENFVECSDDDEIDEVERDGKIGYRREYHRDGYSYIVDGDGFHHHNLDEFKAFVFFDNRTYGEERR